MWIWKSCFSICKVNYIKIQVRIYNIGVQRSKHIRLDFYEHPFDTRRPSIKITMVPSKSFWYGELGEFVYYFKIAGLSSRVDNIDRNDCDYW